MKIITVLFCWFSLFITSSLKAQVKESTLRGSLFLKEGEILKGTFKDEEFSKMSISVKFKADEDKEFRSYTPKDLKKIELENGEIYEVFESKPPRDSLLKPILAYLILKGGVSVYEAYSDDVNIYLISKDGKNYWLQEDQVASYSTALVKFFYKNILYSIVNDSPITMEDVNRVSFNDDILKLITRYNTYKGNSSKIIKPKGQNYKFLIFNVAGIYKPDNFEYTLSGAYRFINPRISRSASLNVGFRYTYYRRTEDQLSSSISQDNYNIFSLPVTLQQNILNKGVRPLVFCGLDFTYFTLKDYNKRDITRRGIQENVGLGIHYGAGIEIDLLKRFMIRSEYRRDVISHFITAGLSYKLRLN
ncbi:outer membrane beta-barrel protein [Pedobacter glucosidilyticus]|uniref:outer membrane beta-barrel protein n=1 Tax=Pedobacter glucosidilyticus TaxID=1122941 RepID=UPI0026F2D8F1|nr:outer membrane beta-barrel protein [Pedobacter glucosidilyticus]